MAPRCKLAMLTIAIAATQVEAQPWQQFATPEEAGFSAEKLAVARRLADSVRSGAVMAVYQGRVLAAWGDVQRELELHSVRKSLVSALYGLGVAEKKIDLERTLASLGIDDRQPLTEAEKNARLKHLLAARSGVYLPAAYAGADQDQERPPRGSQQPGSSFFYNNWDFNLAGVIYERLMGEDLYQGFHRRIAQRIGMEDYHPDDGFRVYEPSNSNYPAHAFRMSARDLARFGQLYLQQGRWDGKQIIPRDWIEESTRPRTDFGGGRGYAYMWWTYTAGSFGDRYPNLNRYDVLAASGTGGQAIAVIPAAELVVVHRGDTDHGREVSGRAVWTMVDQILAAKERQPSATPRLTALTVTPLPSQAPARARPKYLTIERPLMEEYSGEYELAPQAMVRVFIFENRLFMNVPGKGEAELLALSPTEFTIMPVPGVRVVFERNAAGAVSQVVMELGPEIMRASKRFR